MIEIQQLTYSSSDASRLLLRVSKYFKAVWTEVRQYPSSPIIYLERNEKGKFKTSKTLCPITEWKFVIIFWKKNPQTSDTPVLMWIYKKRKVDKLKSNLFKSTLNCLKTNFHKIPVSFTPNVMCSQKHRGGELALFLPLVNELLQYAALRHNLWETCPYNDVAQDWK